MPWASSDRHGRLPSNWKALRKQVQERAGGRCEWIEDGVRCNDPQANQCDHINAGDDHSLANLRWLCGPHHARKSSSEGRQAQLRAKREAKRKFARPVEEHPGRVAAREGFRPPDFKTLEV